MGSLLSRWWPPSPPVWPYGYYVLLRLAVTAVAVYAIAILGSSRTADSIALAIIALLFNPFFPVHFPKPLWVATDLSVAAFFWWLTKRLLVHEKSEPNPVCAYCGSRKEPWHSWRMIHLTGKEWHRFTPSESDSENDGE